MTQSAQMFSPISLLSPHPAQELDPKLELREANARLVAARKGTESLKETFPELESEYQSTKIDLVMEKLRGE